MRTEFGSKGCFGLISLHSLADSMDPEDDLIFPDRVFEVGDRILAAARKSPNPGSWGILLVELKSPELINHWYNGLFFWFDSKAQCLNFLLTDIHLGHRFGWDIFEYVETLLSKTISGSVEI